MNVGDICGALFLFVSVCFLVDSSSGNSRLLRGLPYVVEGLLAALLHLVDTASEEGRQQLPAYRVGQRNGRGREKFNFSPPFEEWYFSTLSSTVSKSGKIFHHLCRRLLSFSP